MASGRWWTRLGGLPPSSEGWLPNATPDDLRRARHRQLVTVLLGVIGIQLLRYSVLLGVLVCLASVALLVVTWRTMLRVGSAA